MEHTTVDLSLHLDVEGEHLSGQMEGNGFSPRTFSGWLGFVSALDALIAEATTRATGSEPAAPE